VLTANLHRSLLAVAQVLLVGCMLAGSVGTAAAAPAADQAAWPYQWPIRAPITDPFRAPASPYGPGNRGIEFATRPGSSIVAASTGTVTFASSVAGRLYVTIVHPDGVRTSYGPLRAIDVQRGATVARGDHIGTTIDWVFVSARIASAYVDPAVLFGGSGAGPAHLVPYSAAPFPFSTATPVRISPTEQTRAVAQGAASSAFVASTKILPALSAFVTQRLHCPAGDNSVATEVCPRFGSNAETEPLT